MSSSRAPLPRRSRPAPWPRRIRGSRSSCARFSRRRRATGRSPSRADAGAMDPRARRMQVALGFLQLPIPEAARPPAFAALHQWLDSWAGIGALEHGMAHQGYDLSLTRYANEGWRATFYNAGKAHAYTSTTA